jgi:hypothetical protein
MTYPPTHSLRLVITTIKTASKRAQGIAWFIIICVLLGTVGAFWLSLSVLVPLWASIGGMIVLLGLLLEMEWNEKNEKLRPPFFSPYKSLQGCGWKILMFGIVVEIVTGIAVAAVEEIKEAKNNPLNQPIATLTASVSLMQLGTNRTSFDPSLPLGGAAFVKLQFGRSKHPEKGWGAELTCASCVIDPILGSPTNKIPNLSDERLGTSWILEFGSSGMGHFLSVIPPNATVRDANEWDVVLFDAPFLHSGTEIIKGDVILTVNSTKRTFEIPPQKVQKAEEFPLTEEEKENGVVVSFRSNITTNPVTVVSWK